MMTASRWVKPDWRSARFFVMVTIVIVAIASLFFQTERQGRLDKRAERQNTREQSLDRRERIIDREHATVVTIQVPVFVTVPSEFATPPTTRNPVTSPTTPSSVTLPSPPPSPTPLVTVPTTTIPPPLCRVTPLVCSLIVESNPTPKHRPIGATQLGAVALGAAMWLLMTALVRWFFKT